MPSWTTMNDLATDDLVTEADMDAIRGNIEYLLAPPSGTCSRETTTTTTSTSFVDVDATNQAITITTAGGHVQVTFNVVMELVASGSLYLDIDQDGSRAGGANGLIYQGYLAGDHQREAITVSWLFEDLEAGSHTFKLQWKVNTGTVTFYWGKGYAVEL
jgi:hypothetical protein